jgi:hypothetical protein
MFCPGSGTKQAQPGSALALQAAFADINIHKSRSVYYVSQRDSGRAVAEKLQTCHIRIYE